MSKAYALPGLRVGWLASKDKALMERVRRRESGMRRGGERERERERAESCSVLMQHFSPPPVACSRYSPPCVSQVNELKDFTTICPATYVEETLETVKERERETEWEERANPSKRFMFASIVLTVCILPCSSFHVHTCHHPSSSIPQ
jgi:aspartate/methionine/tyrosine aminotransferase